MLSVVGPFVKVMKLYSSLLTKNPIKLEHSLPSLLQSGIIFSVRLGAYDRGENLTGAPLWQAPALLINIKLEWKDLSRTNTKVTMDIERLRPLKDLKNWALVG
jgi:hypothetical protein